MNTIRCKSLISVPIVVLWGSFVTAFGQDYDVAWTFGSVGASSYRLDAFDPADADLAPLGSEDPTLPLVLGKRYQVRVVNYTIHPFEVIAKGASASQDAVLLSAEAAGPFESDPDVAWEEDSNGTVRFTLTLSLYQAMIQDGHSPGYRCLHHFASMRGDFTVSGLPIRVDLKTVVSGLTAPILLVPDPTEAERLYVVDQTGVVFRVDQGQLQAAPFLDVQARLVQPLGALGSFDANDFDERGLLGLAFHPGYADPSSPGHGRIYTYTSEPPAGLGDFTVGVPTGELDHQNVILEWRVGTNGLTIDPDSAREVLRIDQPGWGQNAGHLAFGPDGYLYISLGDGGGSNDAGPGHGPLGNGQDLRTAHGSILRIDPVAPDLTTGSKDAVGANGAYRIPSDNPFVGTEGVVPEIYAYGFRDPYRFSFDAETGRLIVADVGQNHFEEIDIVQKGGNYGWNIKEGDFLFDPTGTKVGVPLEDPSLIDPVAQYSHADGTAIIGGHVYRGSSMPDLQGRYVFGDFSRVFSGPEGQLLAADLSTGEIQELLIGAAHRPLGTYVKGLGQDRAGELYVLASRALGPYGDTGVVLKIVPVQEEFVAELSAVAGTNSTATGEVMLHVGIDGETVSYRLATAGLRNMTTAHIHIAPEPAGGGPPAVVLYPTKPPTAPSRQVLVEGEFTTADFIGPLTGMAMKDLLMAIEEGRAYVNVQTGQFPAGEIRGLLQ